MWKSLRIAVRSILHRHHRALGFGDVLQAHDQVRKNNPNYEGIIDTCTLMRSVGKEVHLVEGNRGNIKVTTPEDLYVFRAMLEYKETQQALGLARERSHRI